jgi:uncharacterized protein YrrD
MLRQFKGVLGDVLQATDGHIGHVEELLFDDAQWTIRYLIANTGNFFIGRRVLLAPIGFGELDWSAHVLHVNLTTVQIEESPRLEADEPVSRQFETRYYEHYNWPYYLPGMGVMGGMSIYGNMGMIGVAPNPNRLPGTAFADGTTGDAQDTSEREQDPDPGDEHLRSSKEVTGYEIAADDGHLGHVDDFIFDDTTWAIRYLAVDVGHWWAGKTVLIPVTCIRDVDWPDRRVAVNLTRDQIRNGPEWDPNQPISESFEDELTTYFALAPLATTV